MPETERILEKQASTSGSQSLALKTELFGSKLFSHLDKVKKNERKNK